jgi:hypothetical protein
MHDLRAISAMFEMRADFVGARAFGSGHINDTYCAWYNCAGRQVRYIHQRINHSVFKDPVAVMENVARVTRHALDHLLGEGHPEAHRRTLTCIPARDGKPYAFDPEGNLWRTYPFIEGAKGYDTIENNAQAFEAARAFGAFQKLTADMKGARLHETIPDFHHTPKRLAALEAAIEENTSGRASAVSQEIEFTRERALDCARITDLIANGDIPERVTHNDTKLNNVLLDITTAEAICVIDLDTTMPGSALYDFGDMVRTAASATQEDDPDVSRAGVLVDRFESLVRGYLSAATFLNTTELSHLAFSGKLLTLECGIRFLTDHLNGDTYFKIKRPNHNLERCRNQFAFVRQLEGSMNRLEDLVEQTAAARV